jgi:hypothetical protein
MLTVHQDLALEVITALPPDDRGPILTEKVDAMQQVISDLALTGNDQTADLAVAYTYQRSVQLAGWAREGPRASALW